MTNMLATGLRIMRRPKRTDHRQFLVECKERLVTVLAAPGQSWLDAFTKARANYLELCAVLEIEPLPMTVIGRTKL